MGSAPSNLRKVCEGLKEDLIAFYRNHHSKIQLSPLVEGNDVDLVEFYVEPPMTAIDLQRPYGSPQKSPVEISKQLFYRDDQSAFRNIYVTAGPGFGKTSFSQRICVAWCQARDPMTSIAHKFGLDELLAFKDFAFLFVIPLRDADKSSCDLDEIIRVYLQRHLPRSHYLNMLDIIFNERTCLILLDGLDEWSHPESCSTGHNAREVPHRKFRKNWTILTTTRPWKFDEIRLTFHQIDRHVEINELDEDSSHQLVVNAIKLLNQTFPSGIPKKIIEDFYNTIAVIKLGEIRSIPYIYLQCVCLWFEGKAIGISKCEIYINVIELTLERGTMKLNQKAFQPSSLAESEIRVPKCITGKPHCEQHLSLLLKLGKLAFYALFDVDNRQRLVLDVTFARKYLEQEEIELCLKLGLLSQNKVYGQLAKKVSNVSWLHKTIQECFAALYMQCNNCFEEVKDIVVGTCTSLPSILNMSSTFIFLSGLRPSVYSELSSVIMQCVQRDQNTRKYRKSCLFDWNDPGHNFILNFQTIQVDCVKEMLANGHEFSKLQVEDIIINKQSKDEIYVSVLHKLIRENQGNIKSLSVCECKNTEEVSDILQTIDVKYLHSLVKLELRAVARQPDVEQLLKQSMATLQYLCLSYTIYKNGMYTSEMTLLSKESIDMILSLPLLQGLWLEGLIVTHDQLKNLTTFLTSRVTITHINMGTITCSDHEESCPSVQFHLSAHENLQQIGLHNFPISQLQMNTQHLEKCRIGRLPSSVITSFFTSLLAADNLHKLTCHNLSDTDLVTLITTIPVLFQLEKLYISYTDLGDRKLDLSSDMTRLGLITLRKVSMSSSALRALADTICSLSQSVTIQLLDSTVTPDVEYMTVKEYIWHSDNFIVIYDGIYKSGRKGFEFQTVIKLKQQSHDGEFCYKTQNLNISSQTSVFK